MGLDKNHLGLYDSYSGLDRGYKASSSFHPGFGFRVLGCRGFRL